MMKPGEMIDLRGVDALTLGDRKVYNELISNAFGPEMANDEYEWVIAISVLRRSHKGNERISETIQRLMTTVVTTRLPNGKMRRFQLLGGNDMDLEDRPNGCLTYSFDPRLVRLLRDSFTYGKLQIAVMRAFSSKYALALYEFGAKRVNLDFKTSERHALDDFRAILGVPEGRLQRFSSLKQKAIGPALDEVNSLAEFTLRIEARKTGRKVSHVVVHWESKDDTERLAAVRRLENTGSGRGPRSSRDIDSFTEAA